MRYTLPPMSEKIKMGRIDYIDRLRGLAVFAMFLVHSPYPWIKPEIYAGKYGQIINQISGMVAPVFMFLAGISIAIVANKVAKNSDFNSAEQQGKNEKSARLKLALRGLGIVFAGYCLQFAFFAFSKFNGDWTKFLKVDILHCIGAGIMLAVWLCWPKKSLLKKGINWRALVALIIFVLGAQITWRMQFPDAIPDSVAGYFAHISKKARFPVFPYAGWIVLGLFIGSIWLNAISNAVSENRFWKILAASALLAILLSYIIKFVYYNFELHTLYANGNPPRTTVHTFFLKGGILLLLFCFSKITAPFFKKFDKINIKIKPLILLGRTSLFAYCVHLILIYHFFALFFKRNINVQEHLLAVFVLFVTMLLLCSLWKNILSPKLSKVVIAVLAAISIYTVGAAAKKKTI